MISKTEEAKPFELWRYDIVSLDTKPPTVRPAVFVSRHKTKAAALKYAQANVAEACLFDGARNVVEIRGPDIPVPERWFKGTRASQRGRNITLSAKSMVQYTGQLAVEVPNGAG